MKQSMNSASEEAPTMTIGEVADALQCTDRHLYNMRKKNRMPQPTTIGKKKGIRWSRRVIEEWMMPAALRWRFSK